MKPKTIPGFKFVKLAGGISEYTLVKNGLRVLHMEDRSAPVVAVNITYHVGSRNEAVGHTGSTHILEHLLFQGSKRFNKENGRDPWRLLDAYGADINGTTWFDRTNYYELVPKKHLSDALALEADRMRYALLKPETLATEMTVVRNEYERGENDPTEALDKEIWAAAFSAHPYHHSTIGWKSDIENISIERLREFYNTFYHPNNATLTIVGDIPALEALRQTKKHFRGLPLPSKPIPNMTTVEPPQQGPRRVSVSREGAQAIVKVAHKIPDGRHPDIAALEVLRVVLSEGKSSRLYRSLVDKGLASGVSAFAMPLHDPGLFVTTAHLTASALPQVVEKKILAQYERIKKDGVSDRELKRAVEQSRATLAWSRDGALAIALIINECIAVGEWAEYTTWFSEIEKVTRGDVKRVAKTYLIPERSTTGYFIPKKT